MSLVTFQFSRKIYSRKDFLKLYFLVVFFFKKYIYGFLFFEYVNSVITSFEANGQSLHAMLNLCLEYFILWTSETMV